MRVSAGAKVNLPYFIHQPTVGVFCLLLRRTQTQRFVVRGGIATKGAIATAWAKNFVFLVLFKPFLLTDLDKVQHFTLPQRDSNLKILKWLTFGEKDVKI